MFIGRTMCLPCAIPCSCSFVLPRAAIASSRARSLIFHCARLCRNSYLSLTAESVAMRRGSINHDGRTSCASQFIRPYRYRPCALT